MIAGNRFSQLLQHPLGRRMLGNITMQNLPRGMVDDNEHIEDLERRRDYSEEVTCDDYFRMIPDEGGPTLIGVPAMRPVASPLGHVLSDTTWRDPQSELEQDSRAIRSSPHAGFSKAIRRIKTCRSRGNKGRSGRDLSFQNYRNPSRCHRIRVAGLTMTRASRQLNAFDNQIIAALVASSALLGLISRS